jgi:UDPglucose--hexose-1-phosphate uridylyltransferase
MGSELEDGRRILHENDAVVAYIPYAARWAYEAHVTLREHRPSLLDCEPAELRLLSSALQAVVRGYDALFERPFPYVMIVHQAPTAARTQAGTGSSAAGRSGAETSGAGGHLHVEFYPPLRTAEKLKYLAGSEQGAGTFISDTLPEESAAVLREAIVRAA